MKFELICVLCHSNDLTLIDEDLNYFECNECEEQFSYE